MERTEPSLVPEWLKGSGNASAHHQDEGGQSSRQRTHEQDSSSRYAQRRLNSLFTNDRFSSHDKEIVSGNRVYPNFSRGTSYRSSNSSSQDFFDREKEIHHRDWDLDRDRVGFGNSDGANGRWTSSRHDHELPVRRPPSVGNGGRSSENGAGTKATFERNFPSLGAQEKVNSASAAVHSSLGNVAVLSPRNLWQNSSRSGADAYPAAESRSSSLGDSNGASAAAAAPPPIVPKMAEALLQNPPRVRTPPQMSVESLRLEELALRQSRQLVPMIPKATTLITSRDKAKPKLASLVTPKIIQPSNSQVLTRSHHPSPRPDTPKTLQSKLHVLKPGAALPDPATASAGRNSVVSLANAAPRKQKQLLDRRAVPIPPHSASAGTDANRARSKENGISEDKRLQAQAQNRSDFFNAIRKKAATAGNNSKVEAKNETSSSNSAVVEEEKRQAVNGGGGGGGGVGGVGVGGGGGGESSASTFLDNDDKQDRSSPTANGVISESYSIKDGSEEEENRFLRSLGWVEDAGEEDELTEEEINAFYQEVQEHMRSKTSSPLSSVRHNRLQNAVMGLRCGGLNAAGIQNSSDSESDCEVRAAAAATRNSVLTSGRG